MSTKKRIACFLCGKNPLVKDEIGLNKKLLHRQVERIMCLTCLADYLETTVDVLYEKISELKEQGCKFF